MWFASSLLSCLIFMRHSLVSRVRCRRAAMRQMKHCIGETKRSLSERFTEHRQATNNSDHASASAAVPTHFNLPSHSVKDMLLIPLELQVTNNPSRRKAREAYFIQRGQTLTPLMTSTDEMNANFGRFIYCNFFFPTCTIYHLFIHSITLFIYLYLPIFSAYSFVPNICFSFCTIYIILPTS